MVTKVPHLFNSDYFSEYPGNGEICQNQINEKGHKSRFVANQSTIIWSGEGWKNRWNQNIENHGDNQHAIVGFVDSPKANQWYNTQNKQKQIFDPGQDSRQARDIAGQWTE